MNHRILRALGVAGTLVLIAGCNAMGAAAKGPSSLDGSAWVLAGLPGQTVVRTGAVTLQFADDRASGSDGCNRFSGTYTATAQTLQFAQLASTQMACEPQVMEQARLITAALGVTRSYRSDGQRLELLAADGQAVAIYEAQATQLAGTAWTATGINNGKGAVASVAAGTEVTLEFGADGRASGSAGCNRYTTSFTVERDAVLFGPPTATRKMCADPGVMEQEQAFLRALTQVTVMRMEGDQLDLRGADGARAVVLRRATVPR